VFLTNPHNPSGALIPDAEIGAMASMTAERGIPLIVDEVYLDLVDGARSVRSHGGLTIATSSLTKVYGLGGLRIGWALAPPEIVEALRRFHDLASVLCAVPSQGLALKAFERIEALRERARAQFRERIGAVDAWVRSQEGVEWTAPQGTLFGFPRLTCGVSSSDLFDLLLREYDTVIVPGRYFDGYEDHFRIGFGGKAEVVDEGLRRVSQAIERLS
jgi:aspartate/methionine/tyrosine aminotransferase